jgi:hypothetical protein
VHFALRICEFPVSSVFGVLIKCVPTGTVSFYIFEVDRGKKLYSSASIIGRNSPFFQDPFALQFGLIRSYFHFSFHITTKSAAAERRPLDCLVVLGPVYNKMPRDHNHKTKNTPG